jgi:hypothetical protein
MKATDGEKYFLIIAQIENFFTMIRSNDLVDAIAFIAYKVKNK